MKPTSHSLEPPQLRAVAKLTDDDPCHALHEAHEQEAPEEHARTRLRSRFRLTSSHVISCHHSFPSPVDERLTALGPPDT